MTDESDKKGATPDPSESAERQPDKPADPGDKIISGHISDRALERAEQERIRLDLREPREKA